MFIGWHFRGSQSYVLLVCVCAQYKDGLCCGLIPGSFINQSVCVLNELLLIVLPVIILNICIRS